MRQQAKKTRREKVEATNRITKDKFKEANTPPVIFPKTDIQKLYLELLNAE